MVEDLPKIKVNRKHNQSEISNLKTNPSDSSNKYKSLKLLPMLQNTPSTHAGSNSSGNQIFNSFHETQ